MRGFWSLHTLSSTHTFTPFLGHSPPTRRPCVGSWTTTICGSLYPTCFSPLLLALLRFLLEEQPDEAEAFGPASALVSEWRALRTGGDATGNRVDRAGAGVRRWELEVVMLGEFNLTLPPGTEQLDEARRADHLRRRREALASARRDLANAKRMRLLRRILTLGVWWK